MQIVNLVLVTDPVVTDRLRSDSKYVKTPDQVVRAMSSYIQAGDFSEVASTRLCCQISSYFWSNVVCSHRINGVELSIFVEELPQDVLNSNTFHIPNSTGLH